MVVNKHVSLVCRAASAVSSIYLKTSGVISLQEVNTLRLLRNGSSTFLRVASERDRERERRKVGGERSVVGHFLLCADDVCTEQRRETSSAKQLVHSVAVEKGRFFYNGATIICDKLCNPCVGP